MKFLILIPFYLWKSTFRRWLENPIPPFNKILITGVLCLFSLLILVFFNEAKSQMMKQLILSDAYSAYVQEQVSYRNAITTTVLSIDEEDMWLEKFGENEITYIRQANALVDWRSDHSLPIIIYRRSLPELKLQEDGHPIIWLLTNTPKSLGQTELIYFNETPITVKVRKMPRRLQRHLQMNHVIALPFEMAQSLLAKGYAIHLLGSFSSVEEVENFTEVSNAYYASQGRRVRNFSSLELLQNIKKMSAVQAYIRVGIVIGCGFILACVIGAIAWLEYRQESYLFALLRSFGTPNWMLLAHSFFENLTLVCLGGGAALFLWKPVYSVLVVQMKGVGFRTMADVDAASGDISIIFISVFISVILAVFPVGVGLRKPVGLILQ